MFIVMFLFCFVPVTFVTSCMLPFTVKLEPNNNNKVCVLDLVQFTFRQEPTVVCTLTPLDPTSGCILYLDRRSGHSIPPKQQEVSTPCSMTAWTPCSGLRMTFSKIFRTIPSIWVLDNFCLYQLAHLTR